MAGSTVWERLRQRSVTIEGLDLRVDASRVRFGEDFFETMRGPLAAAFREMASLEAGAIANADEGRQVGHYWLRSPERAPTEDMGRAVRELRGQIEEFAAEIRAGGRFDDFLVVGIGGSALGPQLVDDALAAGEGLRAHFLDNTDPDGIDRVLDGLGERLARTLVLVISKSGGTVETRNGMLEVAAALRARGLDPAAQFVAVTMEGSALHRRALEEGYRAVFPMWDWVGGRTSLFSAVGLLPAALAGIDTAGLLEGARRMDEATRREDALANPAALLALSWYAEGGGRGARDMVILPYKDRLMLLARYLQQLVMESLGKEHDRQGRVVEQGLVVYGNKGSTDQHAYVQQLRDGPADFFATFVDVLEDRKGESIEVEPEVTTGDYLTGFLMGTRRALADKGRGSLTITLPRVDAPRLGALLALFERAVGLYASLIDVNAYHQPGVEAGKRAAAAVIELQRRLLAALREAAGEALDAPSLAARLGCEAQTDELFTLLEHLAASGHHRVERVAGPDRLSDRFRMGEP